MVDSLNSLRTYSDELGNQIESSMEFTRNIRIIFRGSNNRIIIDPEARIEQLSVSFDGDNGELWIGPSTEVGPSLWNIRVGQDSKVVIGSNVSTTSMCVISAVEGTKVIIGSDCMFATGVQLRADDGHAIYDVRSKNRVNRSQDIHLGEHVWLGTETVVLGGVSIGPGSVVGLRSVVTRSFPNNCVAVGNPARVVRTDIAWERPHLSLRNPPYRPNASVIEPTGYWSLTDRSPAKDSRLLRTLKRVLP